MVFFFCICSYFHSRRCISFLLLHVLVLDCICVPHRPGDQEQVSRRHIQGAQGKVSSIDKKYSTSLVTVPIFDSVISKCIFVPIFFLYHLLFFVNLRPAD